MKEISNTLHWELGVVPKTEITEKHNYFSPVFCIVPKKTVLLKISKVR